MQDSSMTFDGTVGIHPRRRARRRHGGYRRFAWTTADLTLREWFAGEAQRRGMSVEEDRNGNVWAWWMPAGWIGDPRGAFVTGSHLDSVPGRRRLRRPTGHRVGVRGDRSAARTRGGPAHPGRRRRVLR